MPVTEYRARFKNRNRPPDLDENRDRCRNRYGNNGVHGNAQRAVVCVGLQRMDVRDLHHGQQGEEHQTHQGRNHESSLVRLVPVPFCARCQQHDPLIQDTHLSMPASPLRLW